MAPRETENNAYAKFWGDKQRPLWYVMVFSGAVNYDEQFKQRSVTVSFNMNILYLTVNTCIFGM